MDKKSHLQLCYVSSRGCFLLLNRPNVGSFNILKLARHQLQTGEIVVVVMHLLFCRVQANWTFLDNPVANIFMHVQL
jgi:hypothetical protein